MNKGSASALFVMPRSSRDWRGAEALWITVSGWASAAEKRYGSAWVITTDAIATPSEARDFPLGAGGNSSSTGRITKFIPLVVKTFFKDVRLYRRRNKRNFTLDDETPWSKSQVQLVWEQHDLFSGAGKRLAMLYGVPYVVFVHAPVVWEASRWGVRRPVWGRWLERKFELTSLKKADLVCCVSAEVAGKVVDMGVAPEKVRISPMAVDPAIFSGPFDTEPIKKRFSLHDRMVIGWVGSFRSFHGLELVLAAVANIVRQHRDVILLLVGDGSGRERLSTLARELGIADHVVFTGKVSHREIPSYINLFDITLVSASRADEFHYSPLKLREYLIAGKAVVAPAAGEIPERFVNGTDLMLYPVGDEQGLTEVLRSLVTDKGLRMHLGNAGQKKIHQEGTWSYELTQVLKSLGKDTDPDLLIE